MTKFVVGGAQTVPMEHHRLRKYRGPETWAQVKTAYVAGESGPSVARRFDVGLANLRRRAMKEGWTRNRIATALDLKPLRGGRDDPSPAIAALDLGDDPDAQMEPRAALAKAVRRAAWLISQGQATEAAALLKAADALERLSWAAGPAILGSAISSQDRPVPTIRSPGSQIQR